MDDNPALAEVFEEAGMPLVRLFTPGEANKTLPLVKRIVSDIVDIGRRLRQMAATLGPNADEDEEVKRLLVEFQGVLREMEQLGCSYKDYNFEIGLVDFPAVIDGEAVVLCWRSDEPSVMFYHGLYAGFAGRKAIPEALLEPEETT